MTKDEFINAVIAEARRQGYTIEDSRNGRQVDFGNKKLHEGHLGLLYPRILADGADIAALIEEVALGRPCSHKPMRWILAAMKKA